MVFNFVKCHYSLGLIKTLLLLLYIQNPPQTQKRRQKPQIAKENSIHSTPLSALKQLDTISIRLTDTNDFKQPLILLDILTFPTALPWSSNPSTPLSTTILHFEDNPHIFLPTYLLPPDISFCLDNSYFKFNGNLYSQHTVSIMGSPLVVELAEIKVTDVENTALTTYTDPPNIY